MNPGPGRSGRDAGGRIPGRRRPCGPGREGRLVSGANVHRPPGGHLDHRRGRRIDRDLHPAARDLPVAGPGRAGPARQRGRGQPLGQAARLRRPGGGAVLALRGPAAARQPRLLLRGEPDRGGAVRRTAGPQHLPVRHLAGVGHRHRHPARRLPGGQAEHDRRQHRHQPGLRDLLDAGLLPRADPHPGLRAVLAHPGVRGQPVDVGTGRWRGTGTTCCCPLPP